MTPPIPIVLTELRQKVKENAGLNLDKVQSKLYEGRGLIDDLERKIQKATEEWNAIAEFLRAQGIKPDAVDMPKFTGLLPEVQSEHIVEGELEDEEEEEEDY